MFCCRWRGARKSSPCSESRLTDWTATGPSSGKVCAVRRGHVPSPGPTAASSTVAAPRAPFVASDLPQSRCGGQCCALSPCRGGALPRARLIRRASHASHATADIRCRLVATTAVPSVCRRSVFASSPGSALSRAPTDLHGTAAAACRSPVSRCCSPLRVDDANTAAPCNWPCALRACPLCLPNTQAPQQPQLRSPGAYRRPMDHRCLAPLSSVVLSLLLCAWTPRAPPRCPRRAVHAALRAFPLSTQHAGPAEPKFSNAAAPVRRHQCMGEPTVASSPTGRHSTPSAERHRRSGRPLSIGAASSPQFRNVAAAADPLEASHSQEEKQAQG